MRGKLVELRPEPEREGEREVTLYVKGFLGRGGRLAKQAQLDATC